MPSKRKSSACVDYVPALDHIQGAEEKKRIWFETSFLFPVWFIMRCLQIAWNLVIALSTRGQVLNIIYPKCSPQIKWRQVYFVATKYTLVVVGQSKRTIWLNKRCTHRPSLLPIEWLSEAFGLAQKGWQQPFRAGKFVKLGHLEEVKVVTRFP